MARYTMKKPEKHILILLISLCVFLLVLILYVQGRMVGLQKLLTKKSSGEQVQKEIVEEEAQPYTTNLRIAIKNGDSIYRDAVTITSDLGMQVEKKDVVTTLNAQENYNVAGKDTVRITPLENGQLFIVDKNGKKSLGYEGAFEVLQGAQGTVIVNEIDIEAYLKRVVPSEMPHTYGQEALMAQAVCARTYAYAHSNKFAYADVSAHMDDTVSFQVYNNCTETPETNEAIAETAGQVLTSKGKVLDAFYYSTSCGYGQDGSLFGDKVDTAVFTSEYIGIEQPKEDFDTYIRKSDPSAYESEERYFRWTATVSEAKMDSLQETLRRLNQKEGALACNKKLQKALAKSGDGKTNLGDIKSIKITQRNEGGAAMVLEMKMDAGKVIVNGQLHIREVLGSITDSVSLQNGEQQTNVTTLPSAAFVIDKGKNNTYVIYGGGFGHGVGMSQNGAKALAMIGYSYQDIIDFFYKQVEITEIQ